MLHQAPPLPHVCVNPCTSVVTCGVMETVVWVAMCSGSIDMPVRVYVLIGKSRKMKGSRLLRSTSSVSPIARRKDCLNLAPCRASWVTPRWPWGIERWVLAWSSNSLVTAPVLKRPFSYDASVSLFKQVKGRKCWCFLLDLVVHCAGAQQGALVYFMKLVHVVPDGRPDQVVSPAGQPDTSESLKRSRSC